MSKYGVFLVRIFLYLDWIQRFTTSSEHSVFSPNAGKYGPEKLHIWTFFTQWAFKSTGKSFSCFLDYHLQFFLFENSSHKWAYSKPIPPLIQGNSCFRIRKDIETKRDNDLKCASKFTVWLSWGKDNISKHVFMMSSKKY